MIIKRSAYLSVCIALLAVSSGCGDSGSDNGQPAVTAITADPFVAVVQSTVSSSPNNTEPVATDAIVTTSPQNTEPDPVI